VDCGAIEALCQVSRKSSGVDVRRNLNAWITAKKTRVQLFSSKGTHQLCQALDLAKDPLQAVIGADVFPVFPRKVAKAYTLFQVLLQTANRLGDHRLPFGEEGLCLLVSSLLVLLVEDALQFALDPLLLVP